MSERFEGRGETIRRRPSLLAGAAFFEVVSVVMAELHTPAWASLVEQGLALTLVFAFLIEAYRVRRRGVVSADAGGLRFDGRLLAERRAVVSAYQLSAEQPVVRIVRRRALPVDVQLESDGDAERMLAALGLGIGQSIATFRAAYGSRLRLVSTVLGATLLSSVLGAAAGVLLHRPGPLVGVLVMVAIFAVVMGGAGLRLATQVDVGSDGLLLRRLGQRRFVSYAELASASLEREALVLVLADGERVRLTMGRSAEQVQARDALVRRIEEAREAFAQGRAPESAEALVAPGGRSVGRWLREVRALANARDYRQARLDGPRLWRLLDDATAPPATRAGAALALLEAPDDATRARLRVASEACADPRLRVALTRVADGAPEEELEQALRPLLEVERRSE